MKKRTVSSKKQKRNHQKTKTAAAQRMHSSSSSSSSVDDVLAAAENAMTAMDMEQALKLYDSAAAMLRTGKFPTLQTRERSLIIVLEKLGEIKVSMGDPLGAKSDFEQSLRLLQDEEEQQQQQNPQPTDDLFYHETKASLHLYLGQLSSDQQALESILQGITSLKSCLDMISSSSSSAIVAPGLSTATGNRMEEQTLNDDVQSTKEKLRDEFQRKLSGAYCSVAELYLTDLCFEPDAETRCETYVGSALELKDGQSRPFVDALQTMASLRLSQEEPKRLEAVAFILQAYDKMKIGCEALADLVGLLDKSGVDGDRDNQEQEQALELKDVDAANNLPEFEFRCQTAKLLLECAALCGHEFPSCCKVGEKELLQQQAEQCVDAAISVLGSLLAQNDEVIEIWYLTGCAFAAKNPPVKDIACHHWMTALDMLRKNQKILSEEVDRMIAIGDADEDEEENIQAQLEDYATQIEDVQTKLNGFVDESEETVESLEKMEE